MSVCLSHSAVVVSWPLWKARGRDKVSLLTGWEVPEDRLIVKSGRGQEGVSKGQIRAEGVYLHSTLEQVGRESIFCPASKSVFSRSF